MGEVAIDLDAALEAIVLAAIDATRINSGVADSPWTVWAREWLAGVRAPQRAVAAANWCFAQRLGSHEGGMVDPVYHALGQIAWAAKEAFWKDRNPFAPWYVLRYIADAAIAFNIAPGSARLGAVSLSDDGYESPHRVDAVADVRFLPPPTPGEPTT